MLVLLRHRRPFSTLPRRSDLPFPTRMYAKGQPLVPRRVAALLIAPLFLWHLALGPAAPLLAPRAGPLQATPWPFPDVACAWLRPGVLGGAHLLLSPFLLLRSTFAFRRASCRGARGVAGSLFPSWAVFQGRVVGSFIAFSNPKLTSSGSHCGLSMAADQIDRQMSYLSKITRVNMLNCWGQTNFSAWFWGT